MTRWISEVEDFEKIDKEFVKHCFDSAEKRLRSALEVSDKATTRAFQTLTAIVPSLTIVLTTVISQALKHELKSNVLIPCAIALLLGTIAFVQLYKVIFPREMHQLGYEPKELLVKEYFDNENFKGEASFKLLLISHLEDYQEQIQFMDKQNAQRVQGVKDAYQCINIAFYLLIIYAIILVVLECS